MKKQLVIGALGLVLLANAQDSGTTLKVETVEPDNIVRVTAMFPVAFDLRLNKGPIPAKGEVLSCKTKEIIHNYEGAKVSEMTLQCRGGGDYTILAVGLK